MPCLATCVGPTADELEVAFDLMSGFAAVPKGTLLTDFFARIPGWVLDSLRESEPLWVVAEDTHDNNVVVEALAGLGVSVRVDEGVSTSYVELVLESEWPEELPDRLPGRELRGPLVVVDVRSR